MSTSSIFLTITKLAKLFNRTEKLRLLGIIGFSLVTSFLEIITASIIVLFAQVLNHPETGKRYMGIVGITRDIPVKKVLLYMSIMVGVMYLIKNIVATIEIFYQSFSIQKINYHFKSRLLHRYVKADYSFYLMRNSALGVNVIGEIDHVCSNGMMSLATMFSEGIVFIGLIGMVIYMDPSLALVIFSIVLVLCIVVTKYSLPQFYEIGKKLQEFSLYSSQNLMQFFHAFKEIVLLGKRDFFIAAYQLYDYKRSRTQAVQTALNIVPRVAIEVLFIGLFVFSIAILLLQDNSTEKIISILGGYLYVGFRIMPSLNRIINQFNIFKSMVPYVDRTYNEYYNKAFQENYLNIPEFRFTHSIQLKNVSFKYINADRYALLDVTFTIHKGENIGIVGETGSGKSTLVDLILGLFKPDKGLILVDDKYSVNAYQWHQKIGYVPQSVYLVDDTISVNIAFGEQEINEDKLNIAIDAAQLREFISRLPQGVNTFVGERGIRLSGGERQRIAIARALYHNPEIIIFDEATSALDNKTEKRVMETINAISQSHTVIMIAHRLTTLKDCDRIIVLKHGKIKEITNYKDIISQQVIG